MQSKASFIPYPVKEIRTYITYSIFNLGLILDTTGKKKKKCVACYREVVAKDKKHCIYHSQAYASLKKQYDAWVRAYGGISWDDYLRKLLTLDQTGSWVKDVINIELKSQKRLIIQSKQKKDEIKDTVS